MGVALQLRIVPSETENHELSRLGSGSGVMWIRLRKDNENAWNNFTRDSDSDASGSGSCMASQPKLGLRTKRWSGTGGADYRRPAAHGTNLIGWDCLH